jgi:hypothetical protein
MPTDILKIATRGTARAPDLPLNSSPKHNNPRKAWTPQTPLSPNSKV